MIIEPNTGGIFSSVRTNEVERQDTQTILEEEEQQDRCEDPQIGINAILACSPFLPTSSETLHSGPHYLGSSSTLNSASTLQGKIIASTQISSALNKPYPTIERIPAS